MADRSKNNDENDAIERMNKALKAALETPPKKHKDEPTRSKRAARVVPPKAK